MFSLTHNNLTYTNFTAAELQEAGVPSEVISSALDDAILRQASIKIDALIDSVYTSSPSQSARYEQKHAEAQTYIAANAPDLTDTDDFPFLRAEAPVRGITHEELALSIIAAAERFTQLGAQAEAARASLPAAITAQETEAAKRAACEAIITQLQGSIAAAFGQ